MSEPERVRAIRGKRDAAWSWLGSASLHVVAVASALAAQWAGLWSAVESSAPAPPQLVFVGGLATRARPLADDNALEAEARLAVTPSDPRDESARSPVGGSALRERLERSVDDANQLTLDEQLEALRRRSAELGRVSTVESIDDLAGRFSRLLGTPPRAEAPAAESPAGEFDFTTAQLHDVRKESRADGSVVYRTVLLDAAGRVMETEVDAATGEQLAKIFELIRGNPLLERVYRKIVMSLLDELTRPSPQSQRTRSP